MMKKVSGMVFTLLLALVLIGSLNIFEASESWIGDLQVENPYESISLSDEYINMDDGNETPAISTEVKVRLKSASTLPSAYMNTLTKLTKKYPTVRKQGTYNTCWAFSAAGLAEFDLITDNRTAGSSINLSEAQIAYYTYYNQEDEFGGTAGDSLTTLSNYLQFGGSLYFATRTLLQWEGVVNESFLPYSSSASSLKASTAYAISQNVAHLQNAYIINIHKNQDAVKQEITNHGSVGIGIYMVDTKTYGSKAVYKKTGEKVATYYCPASKAPNHSVNIVGWDDNFPASSFASKPAGNGAWLVRNCWSTSSKNSLYSYFWLSYYDKSIDDEAWVLDFDSSDNYDYNYQYDGCGLIYGINGLLKDSSGNSLDLTTFSNVFEVQGASNENIKAVSVTFNNDSELSYEIKIYTNLTDPSNPQSGVLADTIIGATTYAGTYTIPVDVAESLKKGSYFSVVVTTPSGSYGIDAEYSYDYRKSSSPMNLVAKAGIKKNQSFIYYKDKWRDLSDIGTKVGNLCIKAYTDSASTEVAQTVSLKKSTASTSTASLIWAKTTGATGYQIYRSTKKSSGYKKIATVKKCSYVNKKLKGNTTYYYKVRAYKKKNGRTVYGKFSSIIKIKTQKSSTGG